MHLLLSGDRDCTANLQNNPTGQKKAISTIQGNKFTNRQMCITAKFRTQTLAKKPVIFKRLPAFHFTIAIDHYAVLNK